MLTTIGRLLALLDRRDRLKLAVLVCVLVLVAAAEMAGIAAIMPFMAVVTNPEVIHSNRWLNAVYTGFGFPSDRSFLLFLGLLVLALLVTSNGVKATGTFLTLRYHNRLNYTLSRRLLARGARGRCHGSCRATFGSASRSATQSGLRRPARYGMS